MLLKTVHFNTRRYHHVLMEESNLGIHSHYSLFLIEQLRSSHNAVVFNLFGIMKTCFVSLISAPKIHIRQVLTKTNIKHVSPLKPVTKLNESWQR